MSGNIQIIPGKVFEENEILTMAKLNQILGEAQLRVGAGSITERELAPWLLRGLLDMGGAPRAGTPMHGGYFAGFLCVSTPGVVSHALIVSGKSVEHGPTETPQLQEADALTTLADAADGPGNTALLTDAEGIWHETEAQAWLDDLNSGPGHNGFADWYIPAQLEADILYWHLKPQNTANNLAWLFDNILAEPPRVGAARTASWPAQTDNEWFRAPNGGEHLDGTYWLSTGTPDGVQGSGQGEWWPLAINMDNGGMAGAAGNPHKLRAVRRHPLFT